MVGNGQVKHHEAHLGLILRLV